MVTVSWSAARWVRRYGSGGSRASLVCLIGALASACGGDLGACDQMALDRVRAQEAMATGRQPRPHSGQILVNTRCANGGCHSESAAGDARVGVPAGLDFDVVPANDSAAERAKVERGAATVDEWRESMWAHIESGAMPPEGQRPPLNSQEQETVRNWLACGSPTIPVPLASAGPVSASWESLYNDVFVPRCLGCHNAMSPAAGGGFGLGVMGDPCGAYANVLNAPAMTAACSGAGTLVVPGQPERSLLYDKLANESPSCGQRMPAGGELDPAVIESVRTWIQNGATANCR